MLSRCFCLPVSGKNHVNGHDCAQKVVKIKLMLFLLEPKWFVTFQIILSSVFIRNHLDYTVAWFKTAETESKQKNAFFFFQKATVENTYKWKHLVDLTDVKNQMLHIVWSTALLKVYVVIWKRRNYCLHNFLDNLCKNLCKHTDPS